MEPQRHLPGDSTLVEQIVYYLKAKGIFDEFRHDCIADVDTKSSCQNLSQRVDGYAAKFLANETWHPDLNKNELRNKLRRHIDESGMLAVGADHVVEQVINPKIHQLFLPKIIEVVHQYTKEQNEMLNKKLEASSGDNALSENASSSSDLSKTKTSISDPIADILSFSYSKTKPTPASSTHGKTDNILQKHTDFLKTEKKKEEKISTALEKNVLESPSENPSTPVVTEIKPQIDKEKDKNKKDEPKVPLEASKKVVKEEIKIEKKEVEDSKPQSFEINTPVEENKAGTSLSGKLNVSGKKDSDKNKPKSKSVSIHKSSSSSSEVKKPKKESLEKPSEKLAKAKIPKPSKESSSPTKNVISVKNVTKEEKGGEISKSKLSDSTNSKTSETSLKKSSKSASSKTDSSNLKHKNNSEKSEKNKISKSSDKNEQNLHLESANSEKGTKNIHYSSSYDSSQGSDQDKSSSSSSKKERQKYFSKHTKKESSENLSDSSKASSYKRRSKAPDGSSFKKNKSEKNVIHEKSKGSVTVGEAAKISSRSNSFGSTSSVSSSSNTSKDNLTLNSDEALESSKKDKKKKQMKEKDLCHISKTLPPPPPPPPPSSSLSCELTSSAEVSSIEDTQSSSNSGNSSSDEMSESSSDSEVESKGSIFNTLNENLLNSSTDDINDFYDIFLYSSSSSEFEGFGDSPEKKRMKNILENINESDVSVSSVHTSDLSSYDDELSDDNIFFDDESHVGVRKRLTLKEAQEFIQRRKAFSQVSIENKIPAANKSDEDAVSLNKRYIESSSSLLSSEDESMPSEPKRSLRRERKLNPRYASSEYTSIFNSRKETFITKQSSPYGKNQTPNSSPNMETKYKKESVVEKDRPSKKNSVETRIVKVYQDNVGRSHKTKRQVYASKNLADDEELSDSSEISSSDEMDSIMDKEKIFSEDKSDVPVSDQLKLQFKFKAQSIANHSVNSHPVKRKLKDAESFPPSKRPCSRGSVDSSSSECVPNENKPFNCEKNNLPDEKSIKDSNFKGSDLTDVIKKDLFSKQRTNNNGDILGQKDIFPKNSHGKTISTPERKSSETENSKELSAL